jgi:putative peptide zinc metalloprotease protein
MIEAVMDIPGPASKPSTLALPALRRDIHLYSGPSTVDGAPTWTLHDPTRNLFFRIGWTEFEMLSRWHLKNADAVIHTVNRETTLHISPDNVAALTGFLVTNNLVITSGESGINYLEQQYAARNKQAAGILLQKYLFLRFPLLRPDRLLTAALPWIRPIYTRTFLLIILAGLFTGLFLTMRQWDSFASTFSYLYSPAGMAWLIAALLLAKTVHELGHAFTAKRYGLRIPTMGFALLVFWPVLYTDTTEAWKLTERKQRLAISAAGISAEFIVAVIALLLWNIFPDGPARSAVFVIATTSWVITLFVNSNPFVRFDGYYLLSDYLDIPNLQTRAFELARWKMLEWLFGLGYPRPGTVPVKLQRFVILYAWMTWAYRLLLFTGIGMLVYHLLFKLAGIMLLAAVVSWFIIRPVYLELRSWQTMRDRIHWNRHSVISLLLLLCGLLLLVLPWNTQISAPAVARYTSYYHVYPPADGRIMEVHTTVGSQVTQEQPLFLLESPELEYQLAQTRRSIDVLRLQLDRQATQASTIGSSGVLQSELNKALSKYNGFEEQKNQLEITSPLAGTVIEVTDALTPGRWVNEDLQLALVVNQEDLFIEAYFMEERVNQVEAGNSGRFYPDNHSLPPFEVTITEVSHSAMTVLDEPFQASNYGGDIAVRPQPDGTLIPNHATYKVRLKPGDDVYTTDRILTGMVKVSGRSQSIIGRLWQTILAVVIRESGF